MTILELRQGERDCALDCHALVTSIRGGGRVFAPQVAHLMALACTDDKSDSRLDPCTRPTTCDDASWRPVPQSCVIRATTVRHRRFISAISLLMVRLITKEQVRGTEGSKTYRPTLLETKLGTSTNRTFPKSPTLSLACLSGLDILDAGASPARFGHGCVGQPFPHFPRDGIRRHLVSSPGITRRCLARERSLQRGHGRRIRHPRPCRAPLSNIERIQP